MEDEATDNKSTSRKSILSADVAKQYKPAKGVVAVFACEFGEVDLTKINLEFAGRLAEAGYLNKI